MLPAWARQVAAYLALAVGPILTEELAPLVAGVAIEEGRLGLVPAIVAMAVGGWIATAVLYALGRWRGRWVRRRWPRAGGAIKGLLRAVRRRPWRSALVVRYAFGLRILLPLACGAAHVRPDVFLVGSAVSSVTWTLVFTMLGVWFGEAATRALERFRTYDEYAAGVVVGVGVVFWLIWRRRRGAAPASRAAAGDRPIDRAR